MQGQQAFFLYLALIIDHLRDISLSHHTLLDRSILWDSWRCVRSLLIAPSLALSMLVELACEEVEEILNTHMLEVSVLECKKPLENFLKSIFFALVVGVLTSSDAFLVKMHQLGSCVWKQMLPHVLLLLVKSTRLKALIQSEWTGLRMLLIVCELSALWVSILKHL